MARIVQKYGGTSVGDVERIKKVAERIKAFRDQGHQLVIVVSARAGVTNELIAQAKPPFSPPAIYQSLRHSFATPLLSLDQDIRTMQDLLGHSDMESNISHPHALNYGPVA
jgi:aspartokinase